MRNDNRLIQDEIDTIVAWVEGGAPPGNDADLPEPPTFTTGWQLGEPDYIFEQPVEWTIKPDGAEPYLYFYQPIPFAQDRWASGLELRPENHAVVHHSGAYIVDIPEGYSVTDGYLHDEDGSQVPPSQPMGRAARRGSPWGPSARVPGPTSCFLSSWPPGFFQLLAPASFISSWPQPVLVSAGLISLPVEI